MPDEGAQVVAAEEHPEGSASAERRSLLPHRLAGVLTLRRVVFIFFDRAPFVCCDLLGSAIKNSSSPKRGVWWEAAGLAQQFASASQRAQFRECIVKVRPRCVHRLGAA